MVQLRYTHDGVTECGITSWGEILDHPPMVLLPQAPDSLKWMMIEGNLRIPHQVY